MALAQAQTLAHLPLGCPCLIYELFVTTLDETNIGCSSISRVTLLFASVYELMSITTVHRFYVHTDIHTYIQSVHYLPSID